MQRVTITHSSYSGNTQKTMLLYNVCARLSGECPTASSCNPLNAFSCQWWCINLTAKFRIPSLIVIRPQSAAVRSAWQLLSWWWSQCLKVGSSTRTPISSLPLPVLPFPFLLSPTLTLPSPFLFPSSPLLFSLPTPPFPPFLFPCLEAPPQIC